MRSWATSTFMAEPPRSRQRQNTETAWPSMQHPTLTLPLTMSTVLSPDTSFTSVRAWRNGTMGMHLRESLADLRGDTGPVIRTTGSATWMVAASVSLMIVFRRQSGALAPIEQQERSVRGNAGERNVALALRQSRRKPLLMRLGLKRARWARTPRLVQRTPYCCRKFLMEGVLLVLPQGLCLQRRMISFCKGWHRREDARLSGCHRRLPCHFFIASTYIGQDVSRFGRF